MHPCSPVSESLLHAPALRHPASTRPGAPGEPRPAAWPCGVSGRHPSRVAALGRGELGGLQPRGQRRSAGKAPSALGTCPGKRALQEVTGVVILRSLNVSICDLLSVVKKPLPYSVFHCISFLLLFLGSPALNFRRAFFCYV